MVKNCESCKGKKLPRPAAGSNGCMRRALLTSLLWLTPVATWAFVTGADPRLTGGPFPTEFDCTECHSNTALPFGPNKGPGNVSFSVQKYTPGAKQRITVTVNDPSARRWGFEITARPANALGSQAGTFQNIDGNAQVICDNLTAGPCPTGMLQFATHTRNGTRLGQTGPISFDVDWTAPASDVGDIIFAAAGNAANGNDQPTGDNIYTAQARISAESLVTLNPKISAGGIVGAGLSTPPVQAITANSIFSIFGTDFAPAGTFKGAELVNGRLSTNVGGVCVEVAGARAPLFFVSAGQLNAQAPTLSATGQVPVDIVLNCGTSNEIRSNVESVMMQAAAPQFFFFVQNDNGKNPIAAINAVSFGLMGTTGLIPGVTFTPAKPGDIVALYSTGLGATNPAYQAGELPGGIGSTTSPVTVTIGGVNADVLYAGVAPGLAGLYQINIRVPDSVPDGNLPVSASVASVSTPAGAFLTVKR